MIAAAYTEPSTETATEDFRWRIEMAVELNEIGKQLDGLGLHGEATVVQLGANMLASLAQKIKLTV